MLSKRQANNTALTACAMLQVNGSRRRDLVTMWQRCDERAAASLNSQAAQCCWLSARCCALKLNQKRKETECGERGPVLLPSGEPNTRAHANAWQITFR